jgi:hypothetical protein
MFQLMLSAILIQTGNLFKMSFVTMTMNLFAICWTIVTAVAVLNEDAWKASIASAPKPFSFFSSKYSAVDATAIVPNSSHYNSIMPFVFDANLCLLLGCGIPDNLMQFSSGMRWAQWKIPAGFTPSLLFFFTIYCITCCLTCVLQVAIILGIIGLAPALYAVKVANDQRRMAALSAL